MSTKKILFCSALFIFVPCFAFATIGVSLGNGKVEYKESMRPGAIYTLPSMAVSNSGDETSTYKMYVDILQEQKQLKPDKAWFSFEPDNFVLAPNDGRMVAVQLKLPVSVIPGDYFCYLATKPVQGSIPGMATVGVAAASKLYFTVAPSNIFQGIYYRVASLIHNYAPWTYIVFGVMLLAVLLKVIGKYISFDIAVRKK